KQVGRDVDVVFERQTRRTFLRHRGRDGRDHVAQRLTAPAVHERRVERPFARQRRRSTEPIVKKAAAEIFFMTVAALGFEDLFTSAGLRVAVYPVPDRGGRCLSRGRRTNRSGEDDERYETSE